MTAFFLSFLAALLLGAAGRDGVRVARLAAGSGPATALGAAPGLVLAIWLSAFAASTLAAGAGAWLAPQMPAAARPMFVALALGVAALELAVRKAPRAPAEPTRSTGAILIVLVAAQITDSARFVIAALALLTQEPWLVAAGGTLGSGVALTLAALAGSEWERRLPLRIMAWALAVLLLLAAFMIGLSVRDVLF
ncbi:TMEM165/GDT1 family protein [Altererythrobacter lauratis]|uniref:GDT1 family protein n=1 Tax=Alteraurantiacibacter lauratis TaxID=2054627 RepID=A0ABV7EKB9_9SPHN